MSGNNLPENIVSHDKLFPHIFASNTGCTVTFVVSGKQKFCPLQEIKSTKARIVQDTRCSIKAKCCVYHCDHNLLS